MDQQLTRTTQSATNNLADILERVLDKGIVIAGDIKIQLADVDLLNIKIRLLITSVDRAKELGIDWWAEDQFFSLQAKKRQQLLEQRSTKGDKKGDKKVPKNRAALRKAEKR